MTAHSIEGGERPFTSPNCALCGRGPRRFDAVYSEPGWAPAHDACRDRMRDCLANLAACLRVAGFGQAMFDAGAIPPRLFRGVDGGGIVSVPQWQPNVDGVKL